MLARTLAILGVVLHASAARAEAFVDCPPGSSKKDEGAYSWCQPSVCENDTQCTPNVCRTVGLCMQVGSLSKPGEPDGGARLVATQICAEDKQCPTQQTCSVMKRCVTQAQADKLGANEPIPMMDAPKKSSCGCSVIGRPDGEGDLAIGAGLGAAALSVMLVRARRRGAPRKSR